MGGAFLQWPFMPCEKYTSLSVRLMKALSCSCPPSSPADVYRDGLRVVVVMVVAGGRRFGRGFNPAATQCLGPGSQKNEETQQRTRKRKQFAAAASAVAASTFTPLALCCAARRKPRLLHSCKHHHHYHHHYQGDHLRPSTLPPANSPSPSLPSPFKGSHYQARSGTEGGGGRGKISKDRY